MVLTAGGSSAGWQDGSRVSLARRFVPRRARFVLGASAAGHPAHLGPGSWGPAAEERPGGAERGEPGGAERAMRCNCDIGFAG